MSYYDAHADALQGLQDELDADCPIFSWSSRDWKALPGGAKKRAQLGEGGFSIDADLSIACLVAQFAETATAQRALMLNTRLTYLGELYKIDAVNIAPGGLQITIECSSAHQGA